MPNLTSVGVTSGLGTSGTGTISTLDNLIGTAGTSNTNVLSVQGIASGTASPVSATQSGTWTVQPGNTANTTAWKVTDPALEAAIVTLGQATMANSVPVVVASNQTAIPVSATITNSGTLFKTVQLSATGTVVALVGGKSIRVISAQLIADSALTVKWQSHVTPTDITGSAYLAANGGYVLPYNPDGWFQTISGEALDLNITGTGNVGGSITYI